MYRDQFGEFVCAYWGFLNRVKANDIKQNLTILMQYLPCGHHTFCCTSHRNTEDMKKKEKFHCYSNYFVISEYLLYYIVN